MMIEGLASRNLVMDAIGAEGCFYYGELNDLMKEKVCIWFMDRFKSDLL